MRTTFSLLLLAALALAGCDSMSERVHERFTAVPPKTQVFAGDQQTVHAAALLAFKRLDFETSRPDKGFDRIEASSRIHHSAALGDSRQLLAEVRFQEAGPGQTEVQILLTEEVESNSPGVSTQQPLREHGFYGTFFDTLQQVLAEQTSAPRPQ